MSNKYEIEIQRLLSLHGSDWEQLARTLFLMHPNIVSELAADKAAAKDVRRRRALAFAPSTETKRGPKPNFTQEQLVEMIARLDLMKFNRYGKFQFQSRAAALRAIPGMTLAKSEKWEKALSNLRLPAWRTPQVAIENEFGSLMHSGESN